MPAKLAPSTSTSISCARASGSEDMHLVPDRGGEALSHEPLGLAAAVARAAMDQHERLALEALGERDDLVEVRVTPRADLLDAAALVPAGDLVHEHADASQPLVAREQLALRVARDAQDRGGVRLVDPLAAFAALGE